MVGDPYPSNGGLLAMLTAVGPIYKTCCGIDVHKMKLVACLCKGHKQEIKEFSAKTKDIKAMVDWLEGNKCEMVAMESTSVYPAMEDCSPCSLLWAPFTKLVVGLMCIR